MFRYRLRNVTIFVFLAIVFIFGGISGGYASAETDETPILAIPLFSAESEVQELNLPVKKLLYSPNQGSIRRVPLPEGLSTDIAAAKSSFQIEYIPAGQKDRAGETCSTFPDEAKRVFNAAAAVWANILESTVPITITACWAHMESDRTLGYSGTNGLWTNFSGAKSKTVYSSALANSISGMDLDPENTDFIITYNSKFDWYYGTDGNTPFHKVDLFSVVLHEIAHGLNFSGLARYENGVGRMSFPELAGTYDRYMEDFTGKLLISYTSPSIELGSAFTSNSLYFSGPNAMAANGGKRVRMYAPSQWRPGSSYSHLNNDTFKDTPHQMMISYIPNGVSIHDPGTITIGLLKDLGWNQTPGGNPTIMPLPALTLLISKSETTPPPPPPPPKKNPQWGAGNGVCCKSVSNWSNFTISAERITRDSSLASCTDKNSWEGWVESTPGSKYFSWNLDVSDCGDYSGSFYYTLENNKNYFFYAKVHEGSVEVWVRTYDAESITEGSKGMPSNDAEIVEHKRLYSIPIDTSKAALEKCLSVENE